MRKWTKLVVALVLVLVAVSAFIMRDRGTAETEAPLETQVAARGSLEVTAEAAGLIEPIRLVEVKSKASGEITRLHVETGDVVTRNELLGEVDPRDVRNTFAQAEADLAVAEARMKTASAQKTRSQELLAANVITEQEFESAAFEEANAKSQLVKAQVNLELARERLGDVTILAPTDGVIISKSVEEGTIIQSASQNISGGSIIFTMADLSQMQVRTLVDETDLGKIKAGQRSRVSVEAYPGRTFIGTVLKIEPQAVVEQNVTMFPVLVHLENRDGALRPGMNAEVVIEVAQRSDVVTIPNAAIVTMRDAVAAGTMLGLTEEQMRTAMRGNFGANSADTTQRVADAAGVTSTPQTTAPNVAAAPAGQPQRAQVRGGEGNGRMQRNGARSGLTNGDTRMGIVFVRTDTTIAPRTVVLGLNDWDNTEVIRGIEPGEEVVLISVARLQQQQQDMLDRFRSRQSTFPGAGGGGRGR